MAIDLQEFVDSIESVELVKIPVLDDIRKRIEANEFKDSEELASALTEEGILSSFQSTCIQKGKARTLRFGEYVVVDQIGHGGMGVVYLGSHMRMNRQVAIKALPIDALQTKRKRKQERFRRETKAIGQLNHPNIIQAFDAGEDRGIHYLVMRYVKGTDLDSMVKEDGPLPIKSALGYIRQVADGLAYAHDNEIIHRDIKPGNLLVDKNDKVQILDFGLSQLKDEAEDGDVESLTKSGMVLGTVDYIAPEQAFDIKNVDHRCDIYSMGCTLFYLLNGRAMYPRDSMMNKLVAHKEEPIPRLFEDDDSLNSEMLSLQADTEALFQKMVAKDKNDRFQTALECLDAIDDIMAGRITLFGPVKDPDSEDESDTKQSDSTIDTSVPSNRWSLSSVVVLGVVLSAIGFGLGWLVNRGVGGDFTSTRVVQSPSDDEASDQLPYGERRYLNFDGKAYARISPEKYKYNMSTDATWEMWINPSVANGTIFGDVQGSGFQVYISPRGHWAVCVHDGQTGGAKGFTNLISHAPAQVGVWTHVAAVHRKRSLTLFVNGTKVIHAPTNGKYLKSKFDTMIGADPDGNNQPYRPFKGQLRQLRISKVARYSAEFKPPKTTGMDSDTVAFYTFDRISNRKDLLFDKTGNGADAVIENPNWASSLETQLTQAHSSERFAFLDDFTDLSKHFDSTGGINQADKKLELKSVFNLKLRDKVDFYSAFIDLQFDEDKPVLFWLKKAFANDGTHIGGYQLKILPSQGCEIIKVNEDKSETQMGKNPKPLPVGKPIRFSILFCNVRCMLNVDDETYLSVYDSGVPQPTFGSFEIESTDPQARMNIQSIRLNDLNNAYHEVKRNYFTDAPGWFQKYQIENQNLTLDQMALIWVARMGGLIYEKDTHHPYANSQILAGVFPDIKNVSEVDLRKCFNVNDQNVAFVGRFTNLDCLRLSNTSLENISPGLFQKIPNLRRLDLAGTEVNSEIGKAISQLTKLEVLDLSRTSVDDKIFEDLANCKNLRQLELEFTMIQSPKIENIEALTNLKSIDLNHTIVSEEVIEEVKKASPGLNIVVDASPIVFRGRMDYEPKRKYFHDFYVQIIEIQGNKLKGYVFYRWIQSYSGIGKPDTNVHEVEGGDFCRPNRVAGNSEG